MDFRILLRRYFLKSLKILFRFLAERLHRFRTVNVLSLVGESYISHREQEQQVGGRVVESDRRKDYKPAGGFRFEGCYGKRVLPLRGFLKAFRKEFCYHTRRL